MADGIYQDLGTLSDPTRVRLLRLLEQEELGVGELSRVTQVPQSTVSRHLKVLHTAGWVQRRSEGTANLFRVATEGLDPAARRLWAVVREETDGQYAEDARRMKSLVALRAADSREFFRRHAVQWEALRRDLYGEGYLLPTLLSLLPQGLVVADLGCGTGEVLAALAPAVRQVVGIDREAEMLEAARRRTAGMDNVELREGGLERLPTCDRSLDAALCMLVLHHVDDVGAVFREVARALRPGGRFVLLDMVAHDRAELQRTMGHRHLGFSEEDVRRHAELAGLRVRRHQALPEAPEALGPPLFLSVMELCG